MNGRGIYIIKDKKIFEGTFQDCLLWGKGSVVWLKSDKKADYHGDFVKGKPHGYGRINYKNGAYYEGQW